MNRAWNTVFLAGLFEIGWVVGLKHADTFTAWSLTVICIVLSMYLLIKATVMLPVGTAYAVFTGMGTTGTVVLEIVLFGEPVNIVKLLLIGLLLIGVIGLKILSGEQEEEGAL